jgi:predicted kinase
VQAHQHTNSGLSAEPAATTLFLMVGLPGAGKTTVARELAVSHHALRLTPDEWHLPLFGESLRADGKRDILEGRLVTVALRLLRLGTSVVLDFGLWGQDERSALRWLADEAGVTCQVIYLPVEQDVQLARIEHRQANTPHEPFPMPAADVVAWRNKFQAPDATELAGESIPGAPPGWSTWLEWAVDRWPTLDPYTT